MRAVHLTCNDLPEPLGVETPRPLLAWRQEDDRRGAAQQGYEIRVASCREALAAGEADLWHSGTVRSAACVQVPYAGASLPSRQRCVWQVRLTDDRGEVGPWSEPAAWEMGLLQENDWQGCWISDQLHPRNTLETIRPAPLLRRAVELPGEVARARLYVCGLGYCDFYINGRPVSDRRLDPVASHFDRRAYYTTHDVTDLLRPGPNALAAMLGNGLYNSLAEDIWSFHTAPWRGRPKLLCQLHILYADGGEETIVSDPAWRTAPGPILYDQLRSGEHYDARAETPGWREPGFDDSQWRRTLVVPGPGGELCSMQMPPIRVTQRLRPVSVEEVRPGVWVYDLGQNIAGWARLRLSGPAGTTVTLRYDERREGENGDIDQRAIGSLVFNAPFQTDRYTLSGEGEEVWEPRFTYHGFQYVQVTGFPGTPTLENLEGCVAHTDAAPAGAFECGDELLNRIQELTRWADVSNYHGFPTDCPHREKNGWTGDAQLSAEQFLLNFDLASALRKWVRDIADTQRPSGQVPCIVPCPGWGYNWGSGPAWDSALILVPWTLYLFRGDRAVLAELYEPMSRYVDFAAGLRLPDGTVDWGLGDWVPVDPQRQCPTAVTDTAYVSVGARVLAQVAALLDREADAARFDRLARELREAFRNAFLTPATGAVADNGQTALACALYQGMVEPEEAPAVLARLVEAVEARDRHIDTGILGAKYLMHALDQGGRNDLAYAIATQRDFPGWGWWVAQGATTLWENWNGEASRNHHMFGDISAWFYMGLAGLRPDPRAPGFRHVLLRPGVVAGLEWVRAWHASPYGRVEAAWTQSAEELAYEVALPAGTTGTVELPCPAGGEVREGDRPAAEAEGVRTAAAGGGTAVLELGAGRYRLRVPRG